MSLATRSLWQRISEPKNLQSMSPLNKVFTYSILFVWSFVVLFPLYWLFVTSFKLPIHVSDGPYYIPFIDFEPSLHAWKYIFIDLGQDTLRPYLNSIIIASISTVLAVFIGSMSAYALTRIEYKPKLGSIIGFIGAVGLVVYLTVAIGMQWQLSLSIGAALFVIFVLSFSRHFSRTLGNNDILFWIISQRIMPPVVSVLPIYIMFQQLGLLDTHFALIVTYMAVNLPIAVWLMRDFFAKIPVELEESAMLDGASRMRVFLTIYLPLAKPGLAATTMLILILSWNEYLLALFLSTVDAQTMPLMVAAQNATRGPQWWYMSVLIVVMIIPVLIAAGFIGKLINKGQLAGAVKG
ncbi:MAG: carbohydrate ABC transporter permease [Oceanospirillaceae bacterium]|nr:carbohydrate ABC transporter permease [Oceanospirillaceae bacterium]